jgi:hypothetical protein
LGHVSLLGWRLPAAHCIAFAAGRYLCPYSPSLVEENSRKLGASAEPPAVADVLVPM